MPGANPLVNMGGAVSNAARPQPRVAETSGSPADTVQASVNANVGAGDTALHVAALVAAALGVVIILHVAGFRFAVDAGVTR